MDDKIQKAAEDKKVWVEKERGTFDMESMPLSVADQHALRKKVNKLEANLAHLTETSN